MICSALIIDDEPLARKRMMSLLEEYADEIDVMDEAENGEQAVSKIKSLRPDVVFLDIQMPDMDAFDVLHALEPTEVPLVIFTTAYDNFAVKAFEEKAVDYLLKPVEAERLDAAIAKLREKFPEDDFDLPVPPDFSWEKFRNVVDLSNYYLQRLQIRRGERVIFVNVEEVIRFQSEEKWTRVYTINDIYMMNTPLTELEKRLDPRQFVRVHRSSIVAIDYISEYRRNDDGRITLILRDKNNTELLVSRPLLKKLRDL